MKRKADIVDKVTATLRKAGWQGLRTRQLYYDRDEITVYGWLDPRRATRGPQAPSRPRGAGRAGKNQARNRGTDGRGGRQGPTRGRNSARGRGSGRGRRR